MSEVLQIARASMDWIETTITVEDSQVWLTLRCRGAVVARVAASDSHLRLVDETKKIVIDRQVLARLLDETFQPDMGGVDYTHDGIRRLAATLQGWLWPPRIPDKPEGTNWVAENANGVFTKPSQYPTEEDWEKSWTWFGPMKIYYTEED